MDNLEKENRSLNKQLRESQDKYSRDKSKLEQLIKENISTPQNGDFVLLQKKIELLEQTMYEREKEIQRQSFAGTSNYKDKQEIKDLKERIEVERAHYSKIINKKNQEISVFRDELDTMLHELDDLRHQNLEKEEMFMQRKGDLIPQI